MQEHFRLADGVSEAKANSVFNNVAWKMIKDVFKHSRCIYVATYYMQELKQRMKPTQVKQIYLTKDQHISGTIDWLVKNPEDWDWLCGWWVSDQFRVVSERNRLSKESVHHYSMDEHVCKT
jgi:hypothetical protein